MNDPIEDALRQKSADFHSATHPSFSWKTTLSSLTDTVRLIVPPNNILPIIFVPGIMGSNLMGGDQKPVWLMDKTAGQPLGLAWMWARKNPGARQKILHPKRTAVFAGGSVPKDPVGTISKREEFIARGWGEVGETSYHEFLIWLEKKLNAVGWNPAEWTDFSYTAISATPKAGVKRIIPKLTRGIVMNMDGLPMKPEEGYFTESILSDDLLTRAKCRFPVYACGYNWLESNIKAADRLRKRIDKIISDNNRGSQNCRQVILVTHSMGGLVARACINLDGMSAKVAGVVHGVMPSTGAPVAYRRCKVGMADEDFAAGLVIGSNGREVTAVFAQAPGALQLLPSESYKKGWLKIKDERGKVVQTLPNADPYSEIYLKKNEWWGLVDERWLTAKDGLSIKWDEFVTNIKLAQEFHREIKSTFHKNTFVYYGAGDKKQASFETIEWKVSRGITPSSGNRPTQNELLAYRHDQVRTSGSNLIYIGGETVFMPTTGYMATTSSYETSFWKIICEFQDGRGDGTVPASSGSNPRLAGGKNVRQQFRLSGFSHEPSYKDVTAQRVTHYAITKISTLADLS